MASFAITRLSQPPRLVFQNDVFLLDSV